MSDVLRQELRPPTLNEEVERIYSSAVDEHIEYLGMDRDMLLDTVSDALQRVKDFEQKAHERITISSETAQNIGTIWVLSGTGSYDEEFKPEDNPRLKLTPWMGGWDRARISRGVYLARRIAEVRSGIDFESSSLGNIEDRKATTKELIAEYGPTIVYNGYLVETANAEALLDRPGMIIPRQKTKILHADLKVTQDQIKTFEYPDNASAQSKEVAIVSHAPHLGARVLHMMDKYSPLFEGSVPYVSPVATPNEGVESFRLMEIRGLLYYAYLRNQASTKAHDFQFLG